MGRKNYPLFENVLVEKVANEGKSISRIDGMACFIKDAVPGDVVDVQVNRKKSKFYEGYPVKYHSYSADRVEPFCPHFEVCGGCKWQHLDYAKQLEYKQQQVEDTMKHLGTVQPEVMLPIQASPKLKYYRNKMEFTAADGKWLTKEEIKQDWEQDRRAIGLHVRGRFDKVVQIEHCFLQPDFQNTLRNGLHQLAMQHNMTYYNPRTFEGYLRTIMIRNTEAGKWMVVVQVAHKNSEWKKAILNFVQGFAEVASLFFAVNTKRNDSMYDLRLEHIAGEKFLIEEMDGLQFKLGPKSFFQTNFLQAQNLYRRVKELAGLTGDELVYDLYTGTGTIACYLAKEAKKVVGIEYVPEAIEDAKVNAELNGLDNLSFYAGDMKDLLVPDLFKKEGKPDVIITDPPRAGMHPKVVERLVHSTADRIVYISCNPATQARDLTLLSERYDVKLCQPFDMFPHTFHIENIVVLEKKKKSEVV